MNLIIYKFYSIKLKCGIMVRNNFVVNKNSGTIYEYDQVIGGLYDSWNNYNYPEGKKCLKIILLLFITAELLK